MSYYSEHQNNNPQSDPSQPRKTFLQLGAMLSLSSQSLNSNSGFIQRP